MKHHFILTLAAFALVLAACGGGQAQATEKPAEAASVPTNTSEPTATVDLAATEAAKATAAVFNAIAADLTNAGYDTSSGSIDWVQDDAIEIIVSGRRNEVWDDLGITSSFGDFALSVDMAWEFGPNADGGCGMIFRASSFVSGEVQAYKNTYVNFYTSPAAGLGLWGMGYARTGVSGTNLTFGKSSAIKEGQGETNHVLLVARGNEVRLFVNGSMLVNPEDADAATSGPTVSLPADFTEGQIGYLAWAGDGMTTCTFTNGIIWNFGE